MKTYNVAILGATGAVGQEMLKILNERKFPIKELHHISQQAQRRKRITVNEKEYIVEETTADSLII